MAPLEALDKIFILFGEVALQSKQLALKFIEKDIKFEYISADLTSVNWLIVFLSNTYICKIYKLKHAHQ